MDNARKANDLREIIEEGRTLLRTIDRKNKERNDETEPITFSGDDSPQN